MSRLQKALFLSDKGYADLKKAIFACTLTNLAMLLPFCVTVRFLYKGIIIKHNKTEPTYTKTSLFLCEKRRFFMARTEKGVVATI